MTSKTYLVDPEDAVDIPPSYSTDLHLANDWWLEQRMHSHDDHQYRWIFNYVKRKDDKPFGKVLFSNKLNILGHYTKGILDEVKISMDMTNIPNKTDPDKTVTMFLELEYKKVYLDTTHDKENHVWQLTEILDQCKTVWTSEDAAEGSLTMAIDTPFPIPVEIPTFRGMFIPYLDNDGRIEKIHIIQSLT